MNGFVLRRPGGEAGGNLRREVLERHECFAAVLADQAGFAHVARQQRERWGPTAGGLRIGGRRRGQSFVPDLTFVPQLGGQAVSADERMGESPAFPLQLAQGLRQPPGQRQIVLVPKDQTILFPELIEWSVGIESH